MNPRTLSDIEADIRLLGGLTQRAAAASRLIGEMQRKLAAIANKSRRTKRKVRVYCEAWPNPRISSPPWGRGTCENLAVESWSFPRARASPTKKLPSPSPKSSFLAWAATGDKSNPKQAYELEACGTLPAIREHRVHVVRDELLIPPVLPLIEGARALQDVFNL